jgi:hypothetical protein
MRTETTSFLRAVAFAAASAAAAAAPAPPQARPAAATGDPGEAVHADHADHARHAVEAVRAAAAVCLEALARMDGEPAPQARSPGARAFGLGHGLGHGVRSFLSRRAAAALELVRRQLHGLGDIARRRAVRYLEARRRAGAGAQADDEEWRLARMCGYYDRFPSLGGTFNRLLQAFGTTTGRIGTYRWWSEVNRFRCRYIGSTGVAGAAGLEPAVELYRAYEARALSVAADPSPSLESVLERERAWVAADSSTIPAALDVARSHFDRMPPREKLKAQILAGGKESFAAALRSGAVAAAARQLVRATVMYMKEIVGLEPIPAP